MRRLDGISAFMIYNEVPNCYQHTLKIMILDCSGEPRGYSHDQLYDSLDDWLEQVPMLKWKLARVPFNLNHPEWVQDLEFDASYHIRRIACPAPGDKATFNRLVSQLYAQTLDQSRPLWMTWIIEGLQRDRVAMVAMLHHAYSDGAGAGLALQSVMRNQAVEHRSSAELGVDPGTNPGRFTLLLRGLTDLPGLLLGETVNLLKMIRTERRVVKTFSQQGKALPPSPEDAPDSPLNSVFSRGRGFAYDSFALSDITRIARNSGVTVNELLVAIVTGALRRYYRAGGYAADRALVATIPVNVRTAQQENELAGNFVGNAFMRLPIHLADPQQRLQAVAESSRTMKEYVQATGGAGILRAAGLFPAGTARLLNWALRRSGGQLKLLGNIGISNVRGPSEPLWLGNYQVESWLSIGQVTAGVALNITGWSYVGQFNICLMADNKVIPDGDIFAGYLREAFEAYLKADSTPSPAPAPTVVKTGHQ